MMWLKTVAGVFLLYTALFSYTQAEQSSASKARKEQILKQKKLEAIRAARQQSLAEQPIIKPESTATNPSNDPVKTDQLAAEREARCRTQPDAGPEMILLAAGQFVQGSDKNEPGHRGNESPQHEVTIPAPFALSRCEVTVAEFRRFIDDTGYKTEAEHSAGCYYYDVQSDTLKQQPSYFWNNPGFEQDRNHPVVCVSWNDARAYIKWLNDELKLPENTYRLPTESEWEYAARAGTQSAYFWGEQSQCDYANGADISSQKEDKNPGVGWYTECSDGFDYTAPVGSFKPNAWGLYDMSGNVWEWVADCWHDSYKGAPADGSAWLDEGNDACMRSVRGGSWLNEPQSVRSAIRGRVAPVDRDSIIGFRLARTL